MCFQPCLCVSVVKYSYIKREVRFMFEMRPDGVFATRSPRRPNPLGLTVVRLLGREGRRLRVAGLDMLDGTPVLDLKPYLSSVPDSDLRRGWLAEAEARQRNSQSP